MKNTTKRKSTLLWSWKSSRSNIGGGVFLLLDLFSTMNLYENENSRKTKNKTK